MKPSKGLKRTGIKRRNSDVRTRDRPLTSLSPGSRKMLDPIAEAMRQAWGKAARRRPCARCGFREGHGTIGRVEGHHVLPRQNLDHEGVPQLAWYDTRIMLPLCSDPAPNRCHDRLENWIKGRDAEGYEDFRLSRAFVLAKAPGALEYAREHGLVWLFDRLYPPG